MKTNSFFEESWNDLKLQDITDFRATHIDPKINKLQKWVDENPTLFVLEDDCLHMDTNKTDFGTSLDVLAQVTDNGVVWICFDDTENIENLNSDNYSIASIKVKYDEDYEYNTFDEYNLDSDTIKTVAESESIEQCWTTQKDCSYIENYNYSIYLEVILKR